MSVYNPAIPASTHLISADQGPMQTNFFQLNAQFGVDHQAFETGGVNGDGHHLQVTIDAPLGSAPSATGTVGIYYTNSVGGVISPYFTNAVGPVSLWSGGSGTGLATQTLANNGQLNLPNGFQMRWGNSTTNGTTNQSMSFTPAFTNTCYAVTLTKATTGNNTINLSMSNATPPNSTNFFVNSDNAVEFYWIAIGS